MSKNVLIVTGSNYTSQVYEAFWDVKKMGHKLYLLSDGSFEPKDGVFEKHFVHDLRRTKEVLNYMASRPVEFDAVTIKTSEWLTPLTALLAKQYGCIGNDPKVAFYCRSKYHMRECLKEYGVPQPEFKLCRNFEELEKAVQVIGTPCVAKPVGGNASYGTFMICGDEDIGWLKDVYNKSIKYLKRKATAEDMFAFSTEEMDLIGIHDHVDMVTDYLVEGFMEGHEISVDALVQDGEIMIMGIADQVRMPPPYFVQLEERMPFICSEDEKREIEELIYNTINAMRIKDSATHTEIIFTPDGPKIVEIGCRIGGDNIHDSVYQTTGYNLMFESIMIALGEKRIYDIENKCHTIMKYLLPSEKAILKGIVIPPEVINDPDITEIEIFAQEGDVISTPPDSFDFIAYVCAKGNTPEAAKQRLDDAISKITINIK